MANAKEVFRRHIASLQLPQATNKEKVAMLQQLRVTLSSLNESDAREIIPSSNLVFILTNILTENKQWAVECPTWLNALVRYIYRDSQVKVPSDQTDALVGICRTYLALNENWQVLKMITHVANTLDGKLLLLKDTYFWNIIKKAVFNKEKDIYEAAVSLFAEVTSRCEEWQLKLIEDKQFILDIILLPKISALWSCIRNLAQHPEAKAKLPREVIVQANLGKDALCGDISALLCNESDIKFNSVWLEDRATRLDLLLSGRSQGEVQYNLLDLVLPLANLSVLDSKKEILGKRVVVSLLKVVTEDLPNISEIQEGLNRARQQAAKALWNFAYLESNRVLITKANGIQKLDNTYKQTTDTLVKKSIEGLLQMFSPAEHHAVPTNARKSHIMVSYNWRNQGLVKTIVKSLKDNGYSVWVDYEQNTKNNSTEPKANAIEQADLMLMCMGQKFKDSPHCRWETEWCLSNRIPLVPVLVQPGYKPDGWLGVVLGNKKYYDLSEEGDWDAKMAALITGLGNRGKGPKPTNSLPTSPIPSAPGSPALKPKIPTRDWTLDDVYEWMKNENIENHFELFKKHKFDGKALMELKRLLSPQQPAFYAFICEQLNITELGEMLRLSAALNNL